MLHKLQDEQRRATEQREEWLHNDKVKVSSSGKSAQQA
jgi:hypothetical protein